MDLSRQTIALSEFENFNEKIFSNKIKQIKILIVGCGGIGSVLTEILVRGGFLNISLIDPDFVDKTNLQRQFFNFEDIGKFKIDCCEEKLKKINNKVKILKYYSNLNTDNINSFKNINIIIDCCDNVETRDLINEFCNKNNIVWVYNGAIKTKSMSCVFTNTNLYKKYFINFKDQENCQMGVLSSTTINTACICYNLLLLYLINNQSNILIKNNLLKFETIKINLK